MKIKLVSLIATLTLILGCLVSCSKNNNDAADIHVFYYTYSDTYISSVRGALDATLKADGVTFQDYDGNGNQTTQTEQIQTAITKGAKLIVVRGKKNFKITSPKSWEVIKSAGFTKAAPTAFPLYA